MGKPYEINCTIYTGKAVNSDSVNISWIGPNGDIANESDRITVIPTTSNGYNHTSTMQFLYISEQDENVSYNCTASLSGEHKSLSKSFVISSITGKLIMEFYHNPKQLITRYTIKLCQFASDSLPLVAIQDDKTQHYIYIYIYI